MSTKNAADTNLIQWVKTNPLLTFLLTILCILLIVLFSAFVAIMVSETVEKFIGQLLGSTKKNDTLTFLGIGMGGILLALQAVIANRRAKAMENAAREQAKANQNTEKGQRQERLKNAIEHLGHDSDSVRLGGAYELFHLAQDTKDLRQTVLDILCAHIRQTTGGRKYREDYPSKPSEEVQSLLTLLFVQEHEVFKSCHINLQGSWLNGANLKRARLQGANLVEAHMQGTELPEARLQGARLGKAHLQRATLERAQLQGATLSMALLQGATLSGAHLQGVDLFGAQLQRAMLSWAHLQGATLSGALLQGADLIKTHLQGVHLVGAQLQEAELESAQFQGVGSYVEDMQQPFVNRMRNAINKESDLSEVTFTGGLSREKVDFIVKYLSDEETKKFRKILEPHIDKPASNQLPQDSNAITKPYTKEEAERWIAEYEEAMSEIPKSDNG